MTYSNIMRMIVIWFRIHSVTSYSNYNQVCEMLITFSYIHIFPWWLVHQVLISWQRIHNETPFKLYAFIFTLNHATMAYLLRNANQLLTDLSMIHHKSARYLCTGINIRLISNLLYIQSSHMFIYIKTHICNSTLRTWSDKA